MLFKYRTDLLTPLKLKFLTKKMKPPTDIKQQSTSITAFKLCFSSVSAHASVDAKGS